MEQRTLECGCIEQLDGRQGTVECWALISECFNHATQRIADANTLNIQRRKNEILVELRELDIKIIRPLSEGDTVRVNNILADKQTLRSELNSLN